MATVTGTIKLSSDEATAIGITFVPQDTPGVVSTSVVIAQNVRLVTSSTGTFSATLLEGTYTVQFDNGEEFDIVVPAGSSSYDIVSLFGAAASAAATRLYGIGSPEGVVPGDPGFSYIDTSARQIYWKESGTGTTGWQLWLSAS